MGETGWFRWRVTNGDEYYHRTGEEDGGCLCG